MASDLAKIVKGLVRAILALAVGILVGFEYYAFSPNQADATGPAIAMGVVATLVVFYVLSSLGKHGD